MLNPRVDFAFKKLFGSEENKDILIDFINAVIDEKDRIQDLILKNPYNEKDYENAKLSILDVKAQSIDGTWFNVEIQVIRQDYYIKRTLYYWAKIYSDQLKSGINFDVIHKTICINVLDFEIIKEFDYHNTYVIKNKITDNQLCDDLELHFIELPKYKDNSFLTTLDRWTNFLTKAELYDKRLPQELADIPAIQKAFTTLETVSLTDKERDIYDGMLKRIRDEHDRISSALRQGLLEGKLKGRLEGKLEGRLEAKLDTAKNLLAMKLSIDQVCKATDLSLEQLKENGLI